MWNPLKVVLAVAMSWVASQGVGGENPDFACRISEQAVEKFVAEVFPMQVEGTKRIGGAGLGANLAGELKWKATVTNPEIQIGQKKRTFRAKADVVVSGMNVRWDGFVEGRLEIDYVQEDKSLIVRVRDAVVPVDAGFFKVQLDVSDDIPEFRFKVALPEVSLPDRNKVVRVEANPVIDYVDNAIVVSSDLRFVSDEESR